MILYTALAWGEVIHKSKYWKILQIVQRRMAIKEYSGYKTISTEALDTPPINLLIIEGKEFYEARNEMILNWQER